MNRRYAVLLLAAAAAIVVRCSCGDDPLRVATFNIENYPRSEQQVDGAFSLLDELEVQAVAAQEITKPDVFERDAQQRLGASWRFVHSGSGRQRVGVLYDSAVFELLGSRVHRQTVTYKDAKPVLEARLRPRRGGETLRFFSLHLKAGGEHAATRATQLRALTPVVAEAARSGERVIVAGDYNATGPDDRTGIARFAAKTGLHWATEDLECTAYWARRDECRGSALDHVVTSVATAEATARGPCETEGCQPGNSCPAFHAQVSDHCPVTLDL